MWYHDSLARGELKHLLKVGKILFAGNKNLKVYGTLHCGSGKRMKTSNRVFFATEEEATGLGYRPCGNCMRRSKKDRKIIS
jgi:methylphosphotriester-DNA--protein-cysteine methyltransferase